MTPSPLIGVTLAVLLVALPASAESVYQQPADFVAAAFDDAPPSPEVLWIDDELRSQANKILYNDLRKLRMRYWRDGDRTVWILDDIGKDLPITTGIVVNAGKIEQIKVLVFRESRGWEVRYPFFTDQFADAGLGRTARLDRSIDNISGATLSVNSLKRQATLALILHQHVLGEES